MNGKMIVSVYIVTFCMTSIRIIYIFNKNEIDANGGVSVEDWR